MIKTLRKLVRIAYGDDLPPVERWALKHANRCSPDEIIAAALVQSFAKDFSKWDNVPIESYWTKKGDLYGKAGYNR